MEVPRGLCRPGWNHIIFKKHLKLSIDYYYCCYYWYWSYCCIWITISIFSWSALRIKSHVCKVSGKCLEVASEMGDEEARLEANRKWMFTVSTCFYSLLMYLWKICLETLKHFPIRKTWWYGSLRNTLLSVKWKGAT